MFQIKVVEKIKTLFMFNNFFSENGAVYEIMWKKYGGTTDNNMAHALCILDK
jgi:hypothetical protein